MVLLSKKNNSTKIEVIKYDEKSLTYHVRFLNGEKEGQTTVYSSGTVKRWWKEIEDSCENEGEKLVSATVDEIPEKELSSTKKKDKKIDRTKDLEKIDNYIKGNFDNSWYESVRCYKIKKAGKTIAEVYPRRKNIEIRVKEIKEISEDVQYKDGYKYYLPVHYFVSYTEDYIKITKEILA